MAVVQEHAEDAPTPPPPTPSPGSANGKVKVKAKEKDDKDEDEKPAEERTAKPERVLPESMREVRREENQEIADWLRQIRGSAPIQVAIKRIKPQLFRGKTIAGHIETREDIISEDELRDTYGGGQYQLRVKRRNDQGSWVFLTSTIIDIAGDPRIDNLAGGDQGSSAANAVASVAAIQADAESKVTTQALAMLERQSAELRDMLKRDNGFDPKMLEAVMRPFDTQFKALQDELRRKDEQFKAMIDKPADPFQQKLLENLIDQDSARITALRTQHDSEIRTLKESHAADVKRLEDRAERERSELKRDYERQIDNMKHSYERELSSLKAMHSQLDIATTSSNTLIKTALERDMARLEREIGELRAENKALREKKDQSLLEKAKEIDQLKEVLGIEGEGEEKNKTAIERVLDTALQSKEVLEFAGKWLGPKDAAGAQPPQQRAPQRQQQLQQTPPRFVRNKRTGEVGEWDPKSQQYVVVQRRAPGGGGDLADLQIPPEQLQMAIQVLERSYANKTKPANFAATISTALPPEIFQAIRDHGVDGFVNKVAKLGASSPLRRQDGINWLREVGKHLLGEENPTPDAQDDEIDDIDDDALNDAPE